MSFASRPARPAAFVLVAALLALSLTAPLVGADPPLDRGQVLQAMKRATTFMVETVSTGGGYVWTYLPDRSRRWGELEATPSMVWVQPPGTATMGHVYLDAYHATGDTYYLTAATKAAGALIAGQHASGGWNYVIDTAGEASLKRWYATVGRNAWRLEEFQHYTDNATFDDGGTIDAAKLLVRLYVETKEARVKAALDRAIGFVLDSQYPVGAWPQRFPRVPGFAGDGKPDYSAYLTFNDDVAGGNIEFLTLCYQVFGEARYRDAIARAMKAYVVTQGKAPQAGWGLQYTPDLQVAAARTYEPRAYVTHTTARNVESLIEFYGLTGDQAFLARIPEALDWLEAVRLPAGLATNGRTHPTFLEVGTNKPLYVHRTGSNVVNGRYFVDENPEGTISHYGSFRHVDVARLRTMYERAKATPPDVAAKDSPLRAAPGTVPLPKYFVAGGSEPRRTPDVAAIASSLNEAGYWPGPLGTTSHPYTRDGSPTPAPGDFSQTMVGDETDTSPFRDPTLTGISTATFIRNMSALIRWLDEPR